MERVHLIGIGGSGMSAIARLLLEMDYQVSGSDRAASPILDELRNMGASIVVGHHIDAILQAQSVVRSSAVPDEDPEVVLALQAGIPVLKRADFLGKIMTGRTVIAVAGTHGKSTTSAMLAWVLSSLGMDPSFLVGGQVRNLGVNAHAGQGSYFVIEADEYDRMFLGLNPNIEIITNVEHDHPDCYPTELSFQEAFLAFVDRIQPGGSLVACEQDPGARLMLAHARQKQLSLIAYRDVEISSSGSVTENRVYAANIEFNSFGCPVFTALIKGQQVQVDLKVPGRHNILNSLAVLSVASLLGLPLDETARALGTFSGVGRRFEVRGEPDGVAIIDDYAHHPTEIRATLAAARSRYPGRTFWTVWQPHTYSRTQLLQDDFAQAFSETDHLIVTEIFAAREPAQDYSSSQVVKRMQDPSVLWIPRLEDVTSFLLENLKPGDVLLVLSAGDATWISEQVQQSLEKRI